MTRILEAPKHALRTESAPRPRPSLKACWILLGIGTLMFVIALPSIPSAPLSQFGLLATASPLFGGSIVVVGLAFASAVRAKNFNAAVAATLMLLVIQRLPQTTATSVPLYSWTYKHLGVVNYIQQHGSLAHGVDVYQGWPGLFGVTAWFADITGTDPDTIAHWFTPAFHLAFVGLIYVLARTWGFERWHALVATFLVEALDWVNQDYYSPQATALLIAIGFLIVIAGRRVSTRSIPIALLLFTAIVVTHQLTPYWLMATCFALTVFRRLHPRSLIVWMIAIAGAFLAFNWDTASQFALLSFDPLSNAQSNVPTIGVFGQQVTSKMVRAVSGLFWLSAAVVGLRMWRKRQTVLPQAVLAFSSFAILAGQGYGGEAIFRVFLYSLPGCALLLAPWVTRILTASYRLYVLAAAFVVGSVVASAQGTYGAWFADRISKSQVEASRSLLNNADFPAYLTVAAPVWPERSTGRYVQYLESTQGQQDYDYPMIYAAKLVGADFSTEAQYQTFDDTMASRTNGPTYLIITRQTSIYDWYFGILPLDALDNLQARMRADPKWKVYADTNQYVIFKSTPLLNGVR